MDKVRFSTGDTHVWQGFHTVGDVGMAGSLVYVTADTLRSIVDHFHNEVLPTDWDRVHNAPTEDWETLAFGDSGTIVSPVDGITPLYRLTFSEATIVQRFDPTKGRTYDRREADETITKVPWGAWVNEETLDAFVGGWSDVDDTFKPVTHGFVIDAKDVAEGRTNAPLIETEYSRKQREDIEAAANGREYVVDVYVPVTVVVRAGDGTEAADLAVTLAEEQGVIERIGNLVDTDDSQFSISDSRPQTEVGEA